MRLFFRFTCAARGRRVQHAAHLVIHVHGRHQRRFGAHCVHQRLHGHAARSVRLHQRHAPALLLQRGHGVLHGGVLVPGGDNMVRPGPAGLCRAEHGHVVAVGAAACKHHLARARPGFRPRPRALFLSPLRCARPAHTAKRGLQMLAQHTARNIRHLIRHGGGGRIVQIMHGFAPQLTKTYIVIILGFAPHVQRKRTEKRPLPHPAAHHAHGRAPQGRQLEKRGAAGVTTSPPALRPARPARAPSRKGRAASVCPARNRSAGMRA